MKSDARLYGITVPLIDMFVLVVAGECPNDRGTRDQFCAALKAGAKCESGRTLWREFLDSFEPGDTGFVVTGGKFGNLNIVWVKSEFDDALVVHEFSHVTDHLLKSTGIGDNREARARIIEALVKELWRLRGEPQGANRPG